MICEKETRLQDKRLDINRFKFLKEYKSISEEYFKLLEELQKIMEMLDLLEKNSFEDKQIDFLLNGRYYDKRKNKIDQCQHFIFYLGKSYSDIEGRRYSIYECPYCGLFYEDGEDNSLNVNNLFENIRGYYNLNSVWESFSNKSITSIDSEDKIFRRGVEKIIAYNIKLLINIVPQKDIYLIINQIIDIYVKKKQLHDSKNISDKDKLKLLSLTFQEYINECFQLNKNLDYTYSKSTDNSIKVKVKKIK